MVQRDLVLPALHPQAVRSALTLSGLKGPLQPGEYV